MNRRGFLYTLSASTLAAPLILSCTKKARVRGMAEVVLSRSPNAVDVADKVNESVVQQLVENGIRQYTGLESVGKAWKSLFPTLQSSTRIGIKINCVAGTMPRQLCTQKETVAAIVNGLEQMPLSGGHFTRENIYVWDRWDDEIEGAGYKLNHHPPGEYVVGISKTMEDHNPKYGYDGDAVWTSMTDKAYFTTLLSRVCDYQINVPVLKSLGRGVTFALKNMYGNFSTTFPYWGEIGPIFHKEFPTRICDLNGAPLIRKKFVIHIGDAILGMKNRGPAGPADFRYGALLFSKDPVALDATGVKIIREQGQEMELAEFMLKAQERGLGCSDLDRIVIETIAS